MLHNEIGVREIFTDVFRPLSKPCAVSEQDDDEAQRERRLRTLCRRIYGWADEHAPLVDASVSSMLSAIDRCAVIALRGSGDLVPVAYAIHRAIFAAERPFVVCDPRRNNSDGSVRCPPNRTSSARALRAAAGGSVCIRACRLPDDYDLLAPSHRSSTGEQLFVCLSSDDPVLDLLCPPIWVPAVDERMSDLDRLINAYLDDATRTIGVGQLRVSGRIRDSILWGVKSLADLEKVVFRLVVLKSAPSTSRAAEQLGMAAVSLSRWAARRDLLGALREIE